jgi:hypothetical protein
MSGSTCFSYGGAGHGSPFFVTVARWRWKIVRLTASPIPVPNFSPVRGSFPVPVASRRPNFSPVRAASQALWQGADQIFSPVRAEGEAEFTSRKQRVDASQLLKGQSENFWTNRRFMFEGHMSIWHMFFSCQCPFKGTLHHIRGCDYSFKL